MAGAAELDQHHSKLFAHTMALMAWVFTGIIGDIKAKTEQTRSRLGRSDGEQGGQGKP